MKRILFILALFCSSFSFSQSTTVVISQVYGAGGNAGALYNADYVELHNVSGTAQSLNGLSLQYTSATGTGNWQPPFVLPNVSIPAGGYYLIQTTAPGANGVAVPNDVLASPTLAMAAAAGKVALVNGTTTLAGCPAPGTVIDLVGFGTTANCYEGSGATPAPSATLAVFRGNNGCTDTDNNSADFTAAAPAPRNSSSPVNSCVAVAPALTVTPTTLTNFGNVFIGAQSTSQTYTVSGTNLTGFPGVITITSSSANFQVSNNNTTWGASTTIAYTTATLAATTVYVRFTPQTAGALTGTITNTGGGATTSPTVSVSGTGVTPPTPTLTASALTAFGPTCVNSTVGPNSFTISGTNLTAGNIDVAALAGYTYSTTSGGTYTTTLSIPQTGGTFSQVVYVKFTPTAIQTYNGNISISGGGSSVNVAASGSGANNPPTVLSGPASAITATSATVAGILSNAGCTSVTAYGITYSTVNGFTTGTNVASTNLSGTNFSVNLSSLTPGTTYYYKAYATNAGGTTYGTQAAFTTTTPILTSTTLATFGNVCVGSNSAVQSFTLTSPGLGTSPVVVGPKAGFTFSTSATGTFTPTLTINQPGGAFSQQVFVMFSPTATQNYNGNIPVTGGNANPINVTVQGNGINTPPTVTTGNAVAVGSNGATFNGSISDANCSPVTSYGIEYSSINNFIPGNGTRVSSTNISGTNFTATAFNLVQNTVYYYRAYAVNAGGVSYGDQMEIRTGTLPTGLNVYSIPASRGSMVRFTIDSVKAGHYSAHLINSAGQVIYRQDYIIQVNFMDEKLIIPSSIPAGAYILRVFNTEFDKHKRILIL